MEFFTIVLTWVSLLGLLVGIFSPSRALFWLHGKRDRKQAIFFYLFLLVLSFLLYVLASSLL